MISMNLLLTDVETRISKMPAAEFGGGGISQIEGCIYELRLTDGLTLVLDEMQLIDLTEAALDVLPDMRWTEGEETEDKGDEWKGAEPV